MYTAKLAAFVLGGVLGSLALPACDLDVTDLNNPPLDDIVNTPTRATVAAACTGLLIGNRAGTGAANGFVSQLGILGRESYNFDAADPRYVLELLEGQLNPGSPFGGNFWAGPYANLRLAGIVLGALDKVPAGELLDEEKAAIRGFTKTIQALDLLRVIVTHDTNGAVIDTDRDLTEDLPPIVDDIATYAKITSLLDEATGDLTSGGDEFPFALSGGFAGFDTPATFLEFNRAIRARVAAYLEDYATVMTALDMSFIDESPTPDLDLGVYYTFSTSNGDAPNGLINPNIYAHKSFETDAQLHIDPQDPMMMRLVKDDRYTRKIVTAEKAGSARGLSSMLQFSLYPEPDSPIALIRNEELILLRAEALHFTGNLEGASAALDLIRTVSGGLLPLAGAERTPDDATFITQLLYERRYSLMFEGHRWIDVRRFDLTNTLPLDLPAHMRNVRYPIPLPECNARPDELACDLGSL
jgi:hypothetical protein